MTWSSLNQNTARLPERFLYPAATAGGEMLGPPEEIAWVDDTAPGGASLEDSLALWERGEALAKRCEEWLEGARKRLAAARNQAGPES